MKSQKTRNLDQYRAIYRETSAYGGSSARRAGELWKILALLAGRRPASPLKVLDFGCGRSDLVDLLAKRDGGKRFEFFRYDPAIPEYSECPVKAADFVINTDVLEHLDEGEIDLLLGDIFALTGNVYFRISTRPARKVLPSGENAHATVQDAEWWGDRLRPWAANLTRLPGKPDQAVFLVHSDPQLGPKVVARLTGGPLAAIRQTLGL